MIEEEEGEEDEEKPTTSKNNANTQADPNKNIIYVTSTNWFVLNVYRIRANKLFKYNTYAPVHTICIQGNEMRAQPQTVRQITNISNQVTAIIKRTKE